MHVVHCTTLSTPYGAVFALPVSMSGWHIALMWVLLGLLCLLRVTHVTNVALHGWRARLATARVRTICCVGE